MMMTTCIDDGITHVGIQANYSVTRKDLASSKRSRS